jgi:preprotein translocase subunit SecE
VQRENKKQHVSVLKPHVTKNSLMNKIRTYIKESYLELTTKVSWPTWSELQSSAIVVLVASLFIGMIIFFMDSIFQGIMNILYKLF